jgi:hypothetical protein
MHRVIHIIHNLWIMFSTKIQYNSVMDSRERKIIRWMHYKAMGKQKFIMVYGRLIGGLLGAALFTAVDLISGQASDSIAIMRIVETFLFRVIMYGIVGGFIAESRWNTMLRKLGIPPEDN